MEQSWDGTKLIGRINEWMEFDSVHEQNQVGMVCIYPLVHNIHKAEISQKWSLPGML